MIKIEMASAIGLYLSFSVVGVLVLWLVLSRNPRLGLQGLDARFIWECGICLITYVDSQDDVYSRCPQCGSINDKKETSNQ